MGKKVIFSPLKKLMEGANELCDAVSSTLGPNGRNVVMYREMNPPYSTKDGVTVAREIIFKDEVKHIGAEMVKQASIETATKAGDGTTTTLVLAQAVLKSAIEELEKNPDLTSPMLVKALKAYRGAVMDQLVPDIKCDERNWLDVVTKVAHVSSNHDPEVSSLIRGAYEKLGKDSIITVQPSKTGETYLDTVPGMRFENGWKHFEFVTNQTTMECNLKEPVVLVTDYDIKDIKYIEGIINECIKEEKSILIIANNVSDLVLKTLIAVQNKFSKTRVCVVKSPALNIRKTEMLKDIAALTGATYISKQFGVALRNAGIEHLGKAESINATKYHTSIIRGMGDEKEIQARIDVIEEQLKEVSTTDQNHYHKKLSERKAALQGGFGIIYAGGPSNLVVKEITDRIDDAICATKAALEEGVVYGGGYAFDVISKVIHRTELHKHASEVLSKALKAPKEKIWRNSAATPPTNYRSYLQAEGILDPLKVLKHSLYNAIEIACLILLTDCLIVNDTEEDSSLSGLPTVDFDPTQKEDDGAV